MKRLYNLSIAFGAISSLVVLNAEAYEPETHAQTTIDSVVLMKMDDEKQNMYNDIYTNEHLLKLVKGAKDEDFGNVLFNTRSFRHFYDPDATGKEQGLPYHDYYKAWEIYDIGNVLDRATVGDFYYQGIDVTEPQGGYYENGLEWARNSAGRDDPYNWEGAIGMYGYTEDSKDEAYLRMGHVVHMVQDMAQPDHAYCYAHPGSSFIKEKDDRMLFGFEALVEYCVKDMNFMGKYVLKREKLDDYIIEMARESKKAVTEHFTVPLGLDIVTVNYGLIVQRDIPLEPNIDIDDAGTVRRHQELAEKLLSYATELNAGLLEQFHDIVNHPPYVRKVEVFQKSGNGKEPGRYEREWIDTIEKGEKGIKQAVGRRPNAGEKNGVSFLKDVEATIRIEFGPDDERMKDGSVTVTVGENPVSGKFTAPLVWEGTFTPSLDEGKDRADYTIEIDSRDLHHHAPREGLPEKEYQLDSDPATVARVGAALPPYNWSGYEPGTDRNHTIIVYDPEKTEEATAKEGSSAFSIYIGGQALIELKPTAYEDKATGKKPYGFINNRDETVIPFRFDGASDFSEGLAAVRKGKLWGYIDKDGNSVVAPQFSRAHDFSEGLALVASAKDFTMQFFIDKKGTPVIDLAAMNLRGTSRRFSEGLAAVGPLKAEKDEIFKDGYINKNGKLAIPVKFYAALDFSEGLAAVKPEEDAPGLELDPPKWGFIDKKGALVIAPQFGRRGEFLFFQDGRALVAIKGGKSEKEPFADGFASANGELRYIDRDGKFLPGTWFIVGPGQEFHEGLTKAQINHKKYGYIDEKGKLVIADQFDDAEEFSEGMAAVKLGDLWGYIDKTGKVVIKPEFGYVQDFSEGLAYAEVRNAKRECCFIDNAGKKAFSLEPPPSYPTLIKFSEGLVCVMASKGPVYLDKTGKVVIDKHTMGLGDIGYLEAWPFHEGMAMIEVHQKWGYIDKTGKVVIQPQFEHADDFSEGLARVAVKYSGEKLCGYIDKTGEFVIDPQFIFLLKREGNFSEGFAVAVPLLRKIKTYYGYDEESYYGYIDKKGKWVIDPVFDYASPFSGGRAMVRIFDTRTCIDKKGKGVKARYWRADKMAERNRGGSYE